MRSAKHLLRLLFPGRCRVCQTGHPDGVPFICPACWEAVHPFAFPWCPQCGRPFASPETLTASPDHRCGPCRTDPPLFDTARAYGPYEGTLKEALHLFKYSHKMALAIPLAERMAVRMAEFPPVDALLAVPLHPRRLRRRGFNQSLLLAQALSQRAGMPLLADALQRVRRTRPQIGLDDQERKRNVRGAFAVIQPERIAEKRLLLVDDVLTTGATADECARVLRKEGAGSVHLLTAARSC